MVISLEDDQGIIMTKMSQIIDQGHGPSLLHSVFANFFDITKNIGEISQQSLYIKRRCGMIANETTIHKRPK